MTTLADDRGRHASTPSEIPVKGWKDTLFRVKDELGKDNISIVASGVAFYFLLAIVPALGATISIYGLVSDPATVEQQLTAISSFLPQEAHAILEDQLTRITSQSGGALGIGAIIGLLLTIWSATKGVKTLMTALNIAYDETESRSFIKLNLIALALTVGAIAFVIIALVTVAALPALFGNLGLEETIRTLVNYLRWPALMLVLIVALGVLYRYGPSRSTPRWRWVSWGAVTAAVLWIVGSGLFSYYVSNFGSYNETYGSLGAVVILLMWFFLTAYIILLGAELNSELEHQTAVDSTVDGTQPMGERGAYVADTLGETHGQVKNKPKDDQPTSVSDSHRPADNTDTDSSQPPTSTGYHSPGEAIDQVLASFTGHQGSQQDRVRQAVRQYPLPSALVGIGLAMMMRDKRRHNPVPPDRHRR